MTDTDEDIIRRIMREELARAPAPLMPVPFLVPVYPKPLPWNPWDDGTGFPPHWGHQTRD